MAINEHRAAFGVENPWANLPAKPPFIAPVDASTVDARFQARFHLEWGVLPVPFVGDPRSARVVLLHENPGYAPIDAEDEAEVDGFADAVRGASTFNGVGFFPLNARFKRTATASWWRERLTKLIEACGIEKVFRRLACIEYFPYHSASSHGPPDVPSQLFTFEVLRTVLRQPTTVVIMRSAADWLRSVPELRGHPRVLVKAARNRAAHVTPGNLGDDSFAAIVRAITSEA